MPRFFRPPFSPLGIGFVLARKQVNRLRGDQIAFTFALETPEERLTYRELLMAATRVVPSAAAPRPATAWRSRRPPGRPFVDAFHACLLLRTPAMLIDPRLGERECSYPPRRRVPTR